MENIRYSKSTGTFYPYDTAYPNGLPADIMDVPIEDFHAAMAREPGHTFDFVGGTLVISPPAPEPFAPQKDAFLAQVRATRELILNRLPGMWMAAQAAGDDATSTAIVIARQALLDITQHPDVLAAEAAENLAALRAAVKAEYKAIATAAPEALRSAFNMVDA